MVGLGGCLSAGCRGMKHRVSGTLAPRSLSPKAGKPGGLAGASSAFTSGGVIINYVRRVQLCCLAPQTTPAPRPDRTQLLGPTLSASPLGRLWSPRGSYSSADGLLPGLRWWGPSTKWPSLRGVVLPQWLFASHLAPCPPEQNGPLSLLWTPNRLDLLGRKRPPPQHTV